MRALWSTVLACSCLLYGAGCGESSTSDTTPAATSNGGSVVSSGGVLGGGGIAANGGTGVGGVTSNGGTTPGSGGVQTGNGGVVGNGGVQNGTGGLLASGGFVGTGGLVGSGGLVGTGGIVGNGGAQATGGNPGTGGTTTDPYPAGPYDDAVNSYLADLQLQGYVNPTAVGIANTKPFTNLYTMDDLRASGVRYALLHNSEFG